MKKIIKVVLSAAIVGLLVLTTGCHQKRPAGQINVGVMGGPDEQLMHVVSDLAKQRDGLNIKIVTFASYPLPNAALADGSIDGNMFQHLPYLKAEIAARGYPIVSVARTFIYPMAIFSRHLKSLDHLKSGAKVAIPNDPSNEARALLLLQKAGLIRLKSHIDITATPEDIISNPKKLQIAVLDAATLPRALDDVSIAVINNNYAIPAGLIPGKDSIYSEGRDSLYANIFVVRIKDQHRKWVKQIVDILHSPAVTRAAERIYHHQAIRGWR